MARTIEQIKASIDTNAAAEGLSSSNAAEWRIWTNIFAYAIWVFEGIMDLFRSNVEQTIRTKQPPTINWYYDQVLKFVSGQSLSVNSDGLLGYWSGTGSSTPTVSQALLTEDSGVLQIRVAKGSEDSLTALSSEELINLKAYIKKIKAPGTQINVSSGEPDSIRYNLTVIYDPQYSSSDISTAVKAALRDYRNEVNFSSYIYRTAILAKIQSVEGVLAADFDELVHKADGDSYGSGVFDYKELQAGYFNFDEASVLDVSTNPEDLT